MIGGNFGLFFDQSRASLFEQTEVTRLCTESSIVGSNVFTKTLAHKVAQAPQIPTSLHLRQGLG